MNKYEYAKNAREISGFGGGYEDMCRNMVITGLKWLDKNKGANPTMDQYKYIFGITTNENKDMKKLQNVMVKVADGCTGAMMQTSTNHVLFAYKNGWEKYMLKMTKKIKKKD